MVLNPAPDAVWSWQVSTALITGSEALPAALARVPALGRRALVVTDPGIREATGLVDLVCRGLARKGVRPAVWDRVEPNPQLALAGAAVEEAVSRRAEVVIGVGGGSAMDVAKLAAAAVRSPELLGSERWAGDAGFVPGPSELEVPLPCVEVPTTVGTGSEMSAAASLVHEGRKKLIVHPALRPRLAVLDPLATRTLPTAQLLAGVFEAWIRVVGLALASPPMEFSDLLAVALAQMLAAAGDEVCDAGSAADEVRLRIALASAHTHAGWILLGRSPSAHPLWYVANELGQAAGATKAAAMAALTPAWLRAIGAGWAPERLGSPDRLEVLGPQLVRGAVGDLALAVTGRLRRWGLPVSLGELGVDEAQVGHIVARTLAAWGGDQPMLGWLPAAGLAALYRSALTPPDQPR